VADHPLRPATDRSLGRPLPHQQANRTRAPRKAAFRPLPLGAHAVLATVSSGYSPLLDRFPRVTHPCATDPEGSVRLACVKHAASVRSEPGSNSQVDHTPDPSPDGETESHRGAPFTDFPMKPLKNLTKVNMNDIPSPHHTGPARRPRIPSNHNQQCQRAKPPRNEPRRADLEVFRDGGPGSEGAALREPLS
jgi:hypothetical protein